VAAREGIECFLEAIDLFVEAIDLFLEEIDLFPPLPGVLRLPPLLWCSLSS
jgi:hypothetical protein